MRRHKLGPVHDKCRWLALAFYNVLICDPRRLWESSLFIRMFAVVFLYGGGSPLTRNHCHRFYLDRLWTRTFIMVKRSYSRLMPRLLVSQSRLLITILVCISVTAPCQCLVQTKFRCRVSSCWQCSVRSCNNMTSIIECL